MEYITSMRIDDRIQIASKNIKPLSPTLQTLIWTLNNDREFEAKHEPNGNKFHRVPKVLPVLGSSFDKLRVVVHNSVRRR